MKRSSFAIAGLALGLVASNAWWAYKALDFDVSYSYTSASLAENQQALAQALAILNASAPLKAPKERILAAASGAWPEAPESFEKEGYIWVGRLGLKFNKRGELIESVREWEN